MVSSAQQTSAELTGLWNEIIPYMATNRLSIVTGFGSHNPSGWTRAYLNISPEDAVKRYQEQFKDKDRPRVDSVEFEDELVLSVGPTNQVIVTG